MGAGATAFMVMVVAAMGAIIAHLKRKRAIAIGLVVLLGVLLGNAPGSLGDWSEDAADWLYERPEAISEMVDGR